METENLVSLIEAYLASKQDKSLYLIGTKEIKSVKIPHTVIKFTYLDSIYEIKVYGPKFMIFKVAGPTGFVCANLKDVQMFTDQILNTLTYNEYEDIVD